MSQPAVLPPQDPMSQPAERRPLLVDSASAAAVTISTQLMIAAVIFLFMVVLFIFFLYLYTKYYYTGSNPVLRRSRARFIFASPDQIPVPRRGLDADVLKSLPVTIFRQADFKDGMECAVCLSELSDGEEARILPKCNHGFHVGCVDMWLHSHTTCPLCRAPVTALSGPPHARPREGVSTNGSWPEPLSFPTNVLFWGNRDRESAPQEGTSSSSRPAGMLVIDIPRRAMPMEDIVSADEMKSPMEEKTPKSARLRSLRRLLSRGKMGMGSSCSPRGGDIEQGVLVGGPAGEGSNPTPVGP